MPEGIERGHFPSHVIEKEITPEFKDKLKTLQFESIGWPTDKLWYRTPDGRVGKTQSGLRDWSKATDAYEKRLPGWDCYHEEYFEESEEEEPHWLHEAMLKAKILFFKRHGLPFKQEGIDKFNEIQKFDNEQVETYNEAQEAHSKGGKSGYADVPSPVRYFPGEEEKPWSREWYGIHQYPEGHMAFGASYTDTFRGQRWADLSKYLHEIAVPRTPEDPEH